MYLLISSNASNWLAFLRSIYFWKWYLVLKHKATLNAISTFHNMLETAKKKKSDC